MLSSINSFINSTIEASGVPVVVILPLWFAFWVYLLVVLPPRAKKGFYSYNTRGRLAGVVAVLFSPVLFLYALHLLWWTVTKKALASVQD